MPSFGIIGCGYWGPNYVRALSDLKMHIEYCGDLSQKNLENIANLNQNIKVTTNSDEIIKSNKVDAIIITTPPNTHYELAKKCLEHGKHVLIEKPFVTTHTEGEELVRLAEKMNKKLMVGELYKFNPGVMKTKELINAGELGRIFYAYSERTGLGPIRKYANALWDLAVHDISIATFILGSLPLSISAKAEPYIHENVEDLVFLTMTFPGNVLYSIHASWLAPIKTRKLTVVGSKKMIVFDDVNKDESVKVFERRIELQSLNTTPLYSDHQLVVRMGDVSIPQIEHSEPLKNQLQHFIDCIVNDKVPLTSGKSSLTSIRIMEAADESIRNKGKEIYLKW